jgi:hypothetical protein
MKRIIAKNRAGNFYFSDDGNVTDPVGYVYMEKESGFHECYKPSGNKTTVDTIQDEYLLPDGVYIVTYYSEENVSGPLYQKVDWGISKQEIINSVFAQRYKYGADYFPIEALTYCGRGK